MQGKVVFTFRDAVGYFIFLPNSFSPVPPVELDFQEPSHFDSAGT